MAFLLGWSTAVEWLRQNHDMGLLAHRYELPLLSIEASLRRLKHHAAQMANLTRPICLVASTREGRRTSREVATRLFTTPTGEYPAVRIDAGLFCSGPELAFLQMASILDEESLRFLGMELCGRYGIDAGGRLFERTQTCTPEMLLETALSMTTVRGRKRARTVAPLVWGGAASPMEAALALILGSSPEQGGYGIMAPELNRQLTVSGKARDLWDDDFITPDLLWEAGRVVIEYDSDLHHTASKRIARDSRRRDVLAELGYRVVTVTTEHMRSPRELDRIAGIVAGCLGQKLPSCSEEDWSRRTSFQLRMRRLATHPELLAGLPEREVRSPSVFS